MSKKPILRNFLSVIPTLGMGFLLFPCVSNIAPTQVAAPRLAQYNPSDFSSSKEISKEDELRSSIVSSTVTDTTHSFKVTFSTGAEGFQNSSKSYVIAVNDDSGSFNDLIKEINEMSSAERTEYGEEIKKGEREPNEYQGYILGIENGLKNDPTRRNIIIPKSFTRNRIFDIFPTKIEEFAVSDWTDIDSINIPSTITSVSKNSFDGAPAGMIFNIEHSENVPDGWDDEWLPEGAILNTKFDYNSLPLNDREAKYTNAKNFGDPNKNYILGYYPEDGVNVEPLLVEYKIEGQTEIQYSEIGLQSTNSNYNSVGQSISEKTRSLTVDIPVKSGERVDVDSIVIRNIYAVAQDPNTSLFIPDITKEFHLAPVHAFKYTFSIDDFLEYSFTKVSVFSTYMAVNLDFDLLKEKNVYEKLNSNYFHSNKENIDNGKYIIRYRLTSLNSSGFRLTFDTENGPVTETIKISTPVKYYNFEKTNNNNVVFLLNQTALENNFKVENITKFEFIGLNVELDLFIPETNAKVARSNVTTRFGNLVLFDKEISNMSVFNVDAFLIIFAISYVALYIIIATSLYFYLKNKFKNDEFRRMKTSRYLVSSSLGLFGLGIVLYALIFIILRFTALANTIVVYNPVDAFIIIFGIASILVIGYFIKNMVARIKAEKQRRISIKLNLDKDAFNDGTK